MAVVKPASKGALMQKLVATSLASLMFAGTLINPTVAQAQSGTTTPIKHVVVIFQENISFDHYFGTYPFATNPTTETPFQAKDTTPTVNNLLPGGLLTSNPNSTQPFRMDPAMSVTCDQNHSYTPEQTAFDHGLMDKFP